jgi:signal transduction histidine kinase
MLKLSGRLINAWDDERARIARELHDDFSQRLALMAMELEQLSQTPAAADHAVSSRLHMVLERITELSCDIHRLSHRLHSSKLQHAGLLTAAKSLCEETARKHHIQIEFVHHDMPETISPDMALCFFRIVQEALNNIVKHSGAKQARIEFSGASSAIRLRIVDAGVGFDTRSRTARRGLGLESMRERLRIIGGSITIRSLHMEGTEILAEAPTVFPTPEIHARRTKLKAAKRTIRKVP